MKSTLIASIAHAINAAYCASIGDQVMPAWDECPESHQQGLLRGVELHIANPETTPEQTHDAWLKEKQEQGWVYGDIKDVEKKTHPCIRPYAELPPEQKSKDYLFRAVVHALKDIPDAEDAVEAFRANLPPPPEHDASAPAVRMNFGVGVRYIGRRPDWCDRMYNTGLHFTKDQARTLPEAIARKLLRHADLFERVGAAAPAVATDAGASETDDDTALLLEQGKEQLEQQEQTLRQVQDIYDQIDRMDKAGLVEFAKVNYRQDLPKNATKDVLRAQVKGFVDQFGVV